jgi:F-type H+-transporting ATPase subunit b
MPSLIRHARESGHPGWPARLPGSRGPRFRWDDERGFGWIALVTALGLPATARAEGMPQLDFANPLTTSQVGWGIVIFALLYVLLARIGLPKVGAVLEERARHIASDLETAQASKVRADEAAKQVAEATARARAEAQAAINAALDVAKREAAARIATLNERLEAQLREAETQINAARSAALRALREVATDTAATVIGRLTGAPADQGRLDGAIGAALAARRIG